MRGVHGGRIHQPRVADGAGAGDVQLLLLGQHVGQGGGGHLHVAGQAQQLLLGVGQRGDLRFQRVLLLGQLGDLLRQGLVGGVVGGEFALHLGLLHVQLRQVGVHGHDLLEQALGLQRQVGGVDLGLVLRQRVLGLVHAGAQLRQLAAHELQAVGGLGGGAVDVLVDVIVHHGVEHVGGAGRIGVLVGDVDDARVLALLGGAQDLLHVGDGVQAVLAHHAEVHAGVGAQRGHVDGDALPFRYLAHLALDQLVAVIVIPACRHPSCPRPGSGACPSASAGTLSWSMASLEPPQS